MLQLGDARVRKANSILVGHLSGVHFLAAMTMKTKVGYLFGDGYVNGHTPSSPFLRCR